MAIQRVANSVITAPGTNALQPPHFRLRFSPAHRRPGEGGQAPSLCLQFEPGEIYAGVERPARSAPVTMLASCASVPPQNTRDSLRERSTSPPIRRNRHDLPLTLRRQAAPLLPQSPACSVTVPVIAVRESTDTCPAKTAGPATPGDFRANTNQRQKSPGLAGPGTTADHDPRCRGVVASAHRWGTDDRPAVPGDVRPGV